MMRYSSYWVTMKEIACVICRIFRYSGVFVLNVFLEIGHDLQSLVPFLNGRVRQYLHKISYNIPVYLSACMIEGSATRSRSFNPRGVLHVAYVLNQLLLLVE